MAEGKEPSDPIEPYKLLSEGEARALVDDLDASPRMKTYVESITRLREDAMFFAKLELALAMASREELERFSGKAGTGAEAVMLELVNIHRDFADIVEKAREQLLECLTEHGLPRPKPGPRRP